jgi:hypothetical protein
LPQLSTGLVIAGAYADKIRRVAFAQLREELKKGRIASDVIVRRTAELNRLLYDVLVNRLRIDKGDVVRIRIEYEVEEGDLKWKLETLQIEAFRRLPDDEVRRAVEEMIRAAKEVLAAPPTAEERAWIEEAKPEEKPEELWRPSEEVVHSVTVIGETSEGERLAAIVNAQGEGAGIAVLKPSNGETRVQAILVPAEHEAYMAEFTVPRSVDEVSEEELKKQLLSQGYRRIDVREAQKIIVEKRRQLV